MADAQRLGLWVALALVAGVGGAPPRIAAPTGGLVVDVVDADPGWGLHLVRAAGQGFAAAAAVAAERGSTPLQQRLIQAVSPTGNSASLRPAEIKAPLGAQKASCSNWSAGVTLKGDYNLRTIEASVEPRDPPGCERLRVGLWLLTEQAALKGDCNYDIMRVKEVEPELREPSLEVLFEDVFPGNYCVRVTPVCNSSSHRCVTITSRVLLLPSVAAAVSQQQQQLPAGGRRPEEGGRLLLWMLVVLPLLLVSALVMAVAVCWVRRRALLAARAKKATLPAQHAPTKPSTCQPPAVVVRVVYSRDSEAHVGVVGALCALLQSELGVCVEYDEAATGPAHVTHDWALAMANLPCPRFNSSEREAGRSGPVVKMLVLESDGALLKHQAYRQHKDLGLVSGSSVDELYHTTYAALLSRQAQALGDYCHLLVARLPCTSLPGRLDLVPEKRFLLPHHLPQLLQALLHNYDHPEQRQQQQQQRAVAAALRSEARARLDRALAGCSAHHREDDGMARLYLLLREGGGQEGQAQKEEEMA